MTEMFMDAISFNQPIEKWNVSKVWDMRGMFAGAKSFNQPIGSWDVSHVDSMSKMFENAESFNQPIGNWDVSRVTSMLAMFKGAKSFNQPIENWSMASVETTVDMFRRAESFRMVKPLWPVLRAEDPTFHGSYMPTAVVLYNSIRACYAREAIHDRELAGRVVMQCVISSDGSVSEIMVKESTLKNKTVEDCIKKEISNRKFPASKDVTVEFPLEFTMRREY